MDAKYTVLIPSWATNPLKLTSRTTLALHFLSGLPSWKYYRLTSHGWHRLLTRRISSNCNDLPFQAHNGNVVNKVWFHYFPRTSPQTDPERLLSTSTSWTSPVFFPLSISYCCCLHFRILRSCSKYHYENGFLWSCETHITGMLYVLNARKIVNLISSPGVFHLVFLTLHWLFLCSSGHCWIFIFFFKFLCSLLSVILPNPYHVSFALTSMYIFLCYNLLTHYMGLKELWDAVV